MTTVTLNELLDQSVVRQRRVPVRRDAHAWIDRGIVLALLLTVGAVTGWGLGLFPALNGDEGIYIQQARAVLHGALSPYTYTYDHPFLGWVQLSALAALAQHLHLGGSLSIVNTRFVMVGIQLVNTALVYGIARRLDMRRVFAVAAVLLFTLSPLTINLARQVYLDNIAMPWVLLAFFLMLNRGRNQWVFAASGAAFAVGVLSKETVLLFAPALAYLLYQRTERHLRLMAGTVAGAVFTFTMLIYPLFALLRGELLPGAGHVSLWTNGVVYQLANRSGSGAVWTAGAAKQQLLQTWLSFDKVLIVGGLVAMVLTLCTRSLRWVGLALLVASVPIVKPSGYLPSMYMICLLPFAALAMTGLADRGWTAVRRSKRPWLRRALVLVLLPATLAGTGFAGQAYAAGQHRVNSVDALAAGNATRDYLVAHVTPTDDVLTDDAFIVDLNRHGLTDPWLQVVSYYKYDLDPTARRKLPHDWLDFSYVVYTPQMRADIKTLGLPFTEAAVAHSLSVATFGSGEERIEVRKVLK